MKYLPWTRVLSLVTLLAALHAATPIFSQNFALHLTAASDNPGVMQSLRGVGSDIESMNYGAKLTTVEMTAIFGTANAAIPLFDAGTNINTQDDENEVSLPVVTMLNATNAYRTIPNADTQVKANTDGDSLHSHETEVAFPVGKIIGDIIESFGKAGAKNSDSFARSMPDTKAHNWLIDNIELTPSLARAMIRASRDDDNHSRTPLHEAAFFNDVSDIRALLAAGAYIEAKDEWGMTALHEASIQNATDAVRILLDAGANVEAKANDGATPLHGAAIFDAVGAMRVLLSAGANVDAKTNSGNTPLHTAVRNEALDAIAVLLDAGASEQVKNDLGMTPFQFHSN